MLPKEWMLKTDVDHPLWEEFKKWYAEQQSESDTSYMEEWEYLGWAVESFDPADYEEGEETPQPDWAISDDAVSCYDKAQIITLDEWKEMNTELAYETY